MAAQPSNNNGKGRNRLPKNMILRGKKDFQEIFETARYRRGRVMDARYLISASDQADCKVAFIAGRKTGKAVLRNKAKRRMREAFRTSYQPLTEALEAASKKIHLVFMIKDADASFAAISADCTSHLNYLVNRITPA